MYEADNAMRIARDAEADKYAPDIMTKAQLDLQNASDIDSNRKGDRKMEITDAREAVERAEDARIASLRKQAAEREAATIMAKDKAQADAALSQQQAAQSQLDAQNSQIQAQQAKLQADQAQAAKAAADAARARPKQKPLKHAPRRPKPNKSAQSVFVVVRVEIRCQQLNGCSLRKPVKLHAASSGQHVRRALR